MTWQRRAISTGHRIFRTYHVAGTQFKSSFRELNGIICRGEQYLPDPAAIASHTTARSGNCHRDVAAHAEFESKTWKQFTILQFQALEPEPKALSTGDLILAICTALPRLAVRGVQQQLPDVAAHLEFESKL
jgi:hypothetical protein